MPAITQTPQYYINSEIEEQNSLKRVFPILESIENLSRFKRINNIKIDGGEFSIIHCLEDSTTSINYRKENNGIYIFAGVQIESIDMENKIFSIYSRVDDSVYGIENINVSSNYKYMDVNNSVCIEELNYLENLLNFINNICERI